jgi:hypothetical protein
VTHSACISVRTSDFGKLIIGLTDDFGLSERVWFATK